MGKWEKGGGTNSSYWEKLLSCFLSPSGTPVSQEKKRRQKGEKLNASPPSIQKVMFTERRGKKKGG